MSSDHQPLPNALPENKGEKNPKTIQFKFWRYLIYEVYTDTVTNKSDSGSYGTRKAAPTWFHNY